MKSNGLFNQSLYKNRFTENIDFRKKMYQSLYKKFLYQFIPHESVILEVGAGYCELINAIEANQRIAVDINPDVKKHANSAVLSFVGSSIQLDMITDESVDIVIANNFFEHLVRDEIIITIKSIRRILKPNGSIIIIQPNYRYCYRDYWMFFDHITPIDDRSMKEVFEANGFKISLVHQKFLPYTMNSSLPKSILFFNIYIKLPSLWKIFGKQFFMKGEIQQ